MRRLAPSRLAGPATAAGYRRLRRPPLRRRRVSPPPPASSPLDPASRLRPPSPARPVALRPVTPPLFGLVPPLPVGQLGPASRLRPPPPPRPPVPPPPAGPVASTSGRPRHRRCGRIRAQPAPPPPPPPDPSPTGHSSFAIELSRRCGVGEQRMRAGISLHICLISAAVQHRSPISRCHLAATFAAALFLLCAADPDDERCLSHLHQSLSDPAGGLRNWTKASFSAPCDGFFSHLQGVTCNNGRVYKLALLGLSLGGTILPELSNCTLLPQFLCWDLRGKRCEGQHNRSKRDILQKRC
uniref:Leucine-rich repeat-containing N-terminal plant-type domain-containing protein n=1 Tax=Setaria viridis TaxID=4556 RepID=A0A4U6VYR3_SETVI|nr:hypothetical protein SEVIR_2G354600v2 [Setaria viridis]